MGEVGRGDGKAVWGQKWRKMGTGQIKSQGGQDKLCLPSQWRKDVLPLPLWDVYSNGDL